MQTCTFSLNGIPIEIHHSHTTAALDLTATFSPFSPATDIEILAAFATHCANANPDVSIAVFQHIHKTYCASDNIHVVVQQLALSPDQAHTVLKGYYSVWDILESHGLLPDAPRPALFSEDNIRLVAMFGGQDGTGHYLDEAALLFDGVSPTSRAFCPVWILSPETRPKAPYLALYPVSIMTVAVVQLMHLMVLYKTLRLSPGELSQSFKGKSSTGAIGHCQGLAFAAMFASLTDEKSFYNGAKENAWSPNGCLCKQPVLHSPGRSPNPREGTPSPMVAIRGIPLPMLNALLAEFNEHCTRPSDNVFLAIINGHENFVVTARTSRFAAPDDDQSHSSFLQRRLVAVINYLPSNLVGHCELLASSADWAYMYTANNGWHLESSDLHIAVHTGPDGHDLRSDANATRAVVDGLTYATHIVDFSPGGAGVFARLTSAIVNGNGTTVISASSLSADSHARFGSKSDLFQLHIGEAHDKRICVDSPMTRVLRLPPVVVLQNLPNAAEAKYVAAISNAGYHVELCCDSILRENAFRDKVDGLLLLLEPGKGFAVNLAYHDQKQWSLDFPAILRKRREGISGSTPPIDIAGEIIGEISHVGIPYIAFRADTVSAVRNIIKIARHNPKYPVVIQRSSNDLHQVILETYSDIRSLPNTVVAVGLYSSDADDILPYITGDWSIKYGQAHMPVDGIILTPALTLAKESQSTRATGSATGEVFAAGPIKGVLQRHGEPDNYLSIVPASDAGPRFFSTRHTQAYQEIHDLVFSKPVDRTTGAASEASLSHAWIDLMYDKLQSRWIDSSYQRLFMKVMGQIEDRFSTTPRPRVLQGLSLLEDPFQMIRDIKDCYPASSDTALVYEDVEFFVWLCKQPGALPVPVCSSAWGTSLGHGIRDSAMYLPENPVPIEHSFHVVNKTIIDCIYSRYYGSDASAVPDTEYLGPDVEPTPLLPSTIGREYTLPLDADQIPEHMVWLEALAGPSKSWLRALLTSPAILKGTSCKSNTVMQALKPTPGQTVRVEHINGHPTSLEIFNQAGNLDLHVTIDRGSVITLTICHRIGNQQHCIPLLYRYLRSSSTTHIAEVLEGRDELHRNLQIAALGGEQQSTVLGVFDPYDSPYTHCMQALCCYGGTCSVIL
ncbi:hypothetical protein DL89DRAFT_284449 [Linderina pennispora]|uniref:Uncharacterized protein n=1 Tax=Linderina pennispora TaxID=61395 RepID=A0A1Y1W708_9FUNG|nr:uncharacterized protein DL89DRAFT_284449 [Linderina pennispora]ORX69118.1 hypothetical protein DL89DRAFT_284449 [Linderina pennispora]